MLTCSPEDDCWRSDACGASKKRAIGQDLVGCDLLAHKPITTQSTEPNKRQQHAANIQKKIPDDFHWLPRVLYSVHGCCCCDSLRSIVGVFPRYRFERYTHLSKLLFFSNLFRFPPSRLPFFILASFSCFIFFCSLFLYPTIIKVRVLYILPPFCGHLASSL